MSRVADIVTALLDVLEAEGVVLRRSVVRSAVAVGLALVAAVLLLAAAGFLLWGMHGVAGPWATAGTAAALALVTLAVAALVAR